MEEFEYAVNQNAMLVSLFWWDGDEWKFARNASVAHGIDICRLENVHGDGGLYVFPMGWNPAQVWNMMEKDAANA